MAQKKAKAPEPAGESAPMWIVSFADLVTLLMSFFVVLYALKQGGAQQQIDTAAAIRVEFDPNYIPPPDSTDPFDINVRQRHGLPGPPYVNNLGKAELPTAGAQGSHAQVETMRPGKVMEAGGRITFDLGQNKVDDTSRATIAQLAGQVRGRNNVLMIKGHVSADEIALRPDDRDGMGLSYQRAVAVIDELEKLGIDRRILRAIPCGPFEPVVTGVYDTNQLRMNRRVEVFTTDYTASDFFPTNTVDALGNGKEPAAKNEQPAEKAERKE